MKTMHDTGADFTNTFRHLIEFPMNENTIKLIISDCAPKEVM
jgi:hypothetical protein